MKLGTIMTMLGMGAVLAACDCCPQGEAKALSQDKELRAVMDNFTQNEVPAATPLRGLLPKRFSRRFTSAPLTPGSRGRWMRLKLLAACSRRRT